MSSYTRNLSNFPFGVNLGQFHDELNASIPVVLGVTIVSPFINMVFNHSLSAGELLQMDATISDHDPNKIPRTNIISVQKLVDPSPTDDPSLGYFIGASWINLTNNTEWVCVDETLGAAIWQNRTQNGGSLGSIVSFIEDIYVNTVSDQYVASFYSTSNSATLRFYTDGDPIVNNQNAISGYNIINFSVSPGVVPIFVRKGSLISTIKGMTIVIN